MIRTVSILGAGNVAFHLTRAFIKNTVQVRQIYNRTLSKAANIGIPNNIRFTDKISELEKVDLFIIAASDKAIEELSIHIPYEDVMVVHTSGAIPLSALKGNYRKGVFYPLQTFSVNRVLKYNDIPFFIEAENTNDEQNLIQLAERISTKVKVANSLQRAKMHLAAVWGCNFVNHMYYLAEKTAKEAGLSFNYLLPLINETVNKVQDLSIKEAQTGPARRNDNVTIEKHINLIEDISEKELYRIITQSITNIYKDEL